MNLLVGLLDVVQLCAHELIEVHLRLPLQTVLGVAHLDDGLDFVLQLHLNLILWRVGPVVVCLLFEFGCLLLDPDQVVLLALLFFDVLDRDFVLSALLAIELGHS